MTAPHFTALSLFKANEIERPAYLLGVHRY